MPRSKERSKRQLTARVDTPLAWVCRSADAEPIFLHVKPTLRSPLWIAYFVTFREKNKNRSGMRGREKETAQIKK